MKGKRKQSTNYHACVTGLLSTMMFKSKANHTLTFYFKMFLNFFTIDAKSLEYQDACDTPSKTIHWLCERTYHHLFFVL